MEVGNYLYQLTARDSQNPTIEAVNIFTTVVSGAISATATVYTVPIDKLLHIDGASVAGIPGAGSTPISMELKCQFANLLFASTFWSYTPEIAHNYRTIKGGTISCLFPPGSIIFASSVFSAAAVGNAVEASFHGWLIPRGNIVSV